MPTKKELLNHQTIIIDKLEKDMKDVMSILDKLAASQLLLVNAISALTPKKKVSKGLKQ